MARRSNAVAEESVDAVALSQTRRMVVTALHDGLRLSDAEKACCALLDGIHTLAEIWTTEAGKALGAKLESHLQTLSRTRCLAP